MAWIDKAESLRPKTLNEYVGQEEIKSKIKVFIEAARKKQTPLDHILFSGPPGLGKTTLAYIIANELGKEIKVTSGNIIDKKGDLAGILTSLEEGDILFIDEIHRLNPSVEETLYPAMEDFKIDIILGKGKSARSIRLELPKFTLIGATTRTGLLTQPLLSRFGIILNFDFYSTDSVIKLLKQTANSLGILLDDNCAYEIAKRSRGVPRIANRLLKRVYDYIYVECDGSFSQENTIKALKFLGIDDFGLERIERQYLKLLVIDFECKPVGINTISTALNEDKTTIEENIEPFLIRIGMIKKTPKGRVPTEKAIKHIKKIYSL